MAQRITCCLIAFLLFAWHPMGANHDSARFELQKGFIILSATIDGRTGSFILDSGAPGLVLNSKRFATRGKDVAMVGSGGSLTGQVVKGKRFEWGSFDMGSIDAFVIDLTYLETSLGREIAGLIGTDLFKGHDILIDYEERTVHIGDDMCGMRDTNEFVALPLERDDHLLTVRIEYRGRSLRFGIDTGSRSNLISTRIVKAMSPKDVASDGPIAVVGADQNPILTEEYIISGLQTVNTDLEPTHFVAQDLSYVKDVTGVNLDGILGHEFFKGSRIWLCKERKNLYVTKSSFELLALR